MFLLRKSVDRYLSIQYHALFAKRNTSFGKKIPHLHCSQWDLSSFTNSKTRHTIGLFKILGELFDIFEWVFLRPVSKFRHKIRPFWGHLTLTLGHMGSQRIYAAFLLRLSVHYYTDACTQPCGCTAVGQSHQSPRSSFYGLLCIWIELTDTDLVLSENPD